MPAKVRASSLKLLMLLSVATEKIPRTKGIWLKLEGYLRYECRAYPRGWQCLEGMAFQVDAGRRQRKAFAEVREDAQCECSNS